MFRAGALRPCPPHHAPCAAHHRGRSQLETGRARPLCSAGPTLARSLQAARHPGQSREEDKTCLHGLPRGPLGQRPARAHLPEPLGFQGAACGWFSGKTARRSKADGNWLLLLLFRMCRLLHSADGPLPGSALPVAPERRVWPGQLVPSAPGPGTTTHRTEKSSPVLIFRA